MVSITDKGKKISFWTFLKENMIEIPVMQRGYAQGRKDKDVLRRNLLSSIKNALEFDKHLTLDFVYGSRTQDKKILLLDGQQRLTTLWLLHWYIALKAKELERASEILKRFSYEMRPSVEKFFENLCNADNFKKIENETGSVVDFVEKQTWFSSEWKQDPTVQSMLRMLGGKDEKGKLDSIEKVFETEEEKYENWWKSLTCKEEALVSFYYLPLEDYGLSDDIYIKMNARGKQLTDFENLKADLIGWMRRQEKESEDSEIWKELLDIKKGVPFKLDTTWAYIFWQNKAKDSNIDEIYFTFINRFFLNYKINNLKQESNSYYLYFTGKNEGGSKDTDIKYRSIEDYKWKDNIDSELFCDLRTVLDRYVELSHFLSSQEKKVEDVLVCPWDKDFRFIPEYKEGGKEVCDINPEQRVIFFSVCKFLKEIKGDIGENTITQIERWMRVVYNLVSGKDGKGKPQIDKLDDIRGAIRVINGLKSQDVYKSLVKRDLKNKESAFAQRHEEEKIKAKKILSDKSGKWEEKIIETEKYAFFNGAIRFLYQDENGREDWSLFDKKFSNAKKYFKEKESEEKGTSCLKGKYDNAKLLKALISRFSQEDFSNVLWRNYKTFNNRSDSWRYYLLKFTICGPVHQILCGKTDIKCGNKLSTSFNRDKDILYLLTQTDLLDFVMKKMSEAWIRNGYHGHYGIYENKKDGVFLDARKRDSFFQRNEGTVELDKSNCVIKDKDGKLILISGVNVCFSYNKKNYLWCEDDCIYVKPDGKPFSKSDMKKDVIEKYCCFSTEGLSDGDIINALQSACSRNLTNTRHKTKTKTKVPKIQKKK